MAALDTGASSAELAEALHQALDEVEALRAQNAVYERSLDFLLAERRRLVAAMHSSEQLAWVAVTSSQWENLERDLRAQLTASAASDVLSGAAIPVAGGVASADPLPSAAASTAAAAAASARKTATKGKRATSARRGKKKDAAGADADAQAKPSKRAKADTGSPAPGSVAESPTPQPEAMRSPGPPSAGAHTAGLSSLPGSQPHSANSHGLSAASPGAAAAHAAAVAAGSSSSSSSSSSAGASAGGHAFAQLAQPQAAHTPYMAAAGAPAHAHAHAHHGLRTDLEPSLAPSEGALPAAMVAGTAGHVHTAPEPATVPAMPPVAHPVPSGHAAILAMHGIAPGQVHSTVLQLIHAADVAYSNSHAAKLAGREDEAAEHEAQRQQMATHIAMAAQQARQAHTLRAYQMHQAAASAGAPPTAWTGASAP